MARVSVYLNFPGTTEEAFLFYKSVFKTEFDGGISRFSDVPDHDSDMQVSDDEKNLVMHVSLPLMGEFVLMGTDFPKSFKTKIEFGNNMSINLEPDTRKETERLYNALSKGGKAEMPLQEMFWGDYYGYCTDKFGIKWMFNCSEKK